MNLSKTVLLVSMLFMFLGMTFYYPKWDLKTGKSTINYDVSGYYWYLPAFFIYEDAKELKWMDGVFKKYRPTPDLQQAFKHESGNYVMKYSIGQSVMYSPFFAASHLYAKNSEKYPADGFSTPYQFGIFYGSLLVGFFGLFMMRKVLLNFFSDRTTALALLALVFGSNWLEYASFTGGMTHNYLFTIYAILIWFCIKFYKNPTFSKSIIIGGLVGLAALTRPTEILAALIPLLWVGELNGKTFWNYKIDFFKKHLPKLLAAIVTCLAIGSIQLIYWKYASGDWLVYSYEDQGFNFLGPYVAPFMWSYKSGWLLYSPIMIFSLIGFYHFYKNNRKLFIACFAFFVPFLWVAFSWKIWWYGGCIGQRTMVQSYPVLLFPMAYFIDWIFTKKAIIRAAVAALALVFCTYNIWLTHHAHVGGLYKAGFMTKAYFWKTLFKNEQIESDLKLLDTTEEFLGTPQNLKEVYSNNFEKDSSTYVTSEQPIEGIRSVFLDGEGIVTPVFFADVKEKKSDWVRLSADFRCDISEWNWWKMTVMKIRLYKGDYVVKERFIRINRFLKNNEERNLFLDLRTDDLKPSRVGIIFDNMWNVNKTWIDNVKIETFDEE